MNKPTKKAVLYARHSSDLNQDESADRQIADMRDYCEKHGYEIAGEYKDEALSGSDENREGLMAALDALKKRYILLVHSFSRLARGQRIQELYCNEVAKKRARLISVTQGPADETDEQVLLRQIFGAVDEYQLKKIRKRTSVGMRRNQANGWRLGGKAPPFGYQEGEPVTVKTFDGTRHRRTIVPNEAEQAVIEEIVRLYNKGMSLNGICRCLTEKKIKFRGKRWHTEKIRRILRREEEKPGGITASPSRQAAEFILKLPKDIPRRSGGY